MQALPSSDLPPPKSGSYSELSFRRLLKSCDEIAAGDTKGRDELQDWQHSPVFYQVCSTHLTMFELCKPPFPVLELAIFCTLSCTNMADAGTVLQYVSSLEGHLVDLEHRISKRCASAFVVGCSVVLAACSTRSH